MSTSKFFVRFNAVDTSTINDGDDSPHSAIQLCLSTIIAEQKLNSMISHI